MSTSAEIIQRLRSMNEAQLREVASATNIPFPSLAKVRYGATKEPRAGRVDDLRRYFEQLDAQTA